MTISESVALGEVDAMDGKDDGWTDGGGNRGGKWGRGQRMLRGGEALTTRKVLDDTATMETRWLYIIDDAR